MKLALFLTLSIIIFYSCNNDREGKDTVDAADSANKANIDTALNKKTVTIDEGTAGFMVKASNMAMSALDLGGLAQQKANSPQVKDFASMMISDHSDANDQIKMLAVAKNVVLPTAPSEDKQDIKTNLTAKTGTAFDKAYMDRMVKDHEESIKLFEESITNVKDPDVSAFADKTLFKLRTHLEQARTIKKGL